MNLYQQQLEDELAELKTSGMFKQEQIIEGRQGARITIDGKSLLNFCGNNYLGLAGSQQLVDAAKTAVQDYGYGMASVRFICGTSSIHKSLERTTADFFGFEDAILYSSCFDANTGLFETLLSEGDAIFSDELNHASIIDGVRLCKAERFRYRHSDMGDLEVQLKAAGPRRRMMIATDGVFSMDGEVAKLAEICALGEKYGAFVMVDDSHGSGVLGETGRGSIQDQGVLGKVAILTSTYGKALGGACGGFTAARTDIVEYLRQRSRPYLFSNSLPPAIAAVSQWVLQRFDSDLRSRRDTLQSNTIYFREHLLKLGFELGGDGRHPITPVMLYDEGEAVSMAQALMSECVYVRGFTYPVVPKGKARIRVQLSAAHSREDLDSALAAFTKLKQV
ncbi:MAG: glycine C-acetyltransferase [Patescibacteria group bacterium]